MLQKHDHHAQNNCETWCEAHVDQDERHESDPFLCGVVTALQWKRQSVHQEQNAHQGQPRERRQVADHEALVGEDLVLGEHSAELADSHDGEEKDDKNEDGADSH